MQELIALIERYEADQKMHKVFIQGSQAAPVYTKRRANIPKENHHERDKSTSNP